MKTEMKKLIILNIIVFGLITPGCEDFLEEDLRGSLGVSNFFNTREDAEASVASVYNGLHGYYERLILLMSALPADDMKNGIGMGNGNLQNLEYARIFSDNQWPRTVWNRSYSIIANANTAIQNVPNVDMNPEIRERLVGEAKFLRALFYFNLVRWFGAVPLRIEPVTDLDDAISERAPVSEVYAQIIQDLEDAEASLPLPGEYEVQGRATRGAAKILLGKVHLTRGEFQEAADKLAEVINNEGEYGYGLHEDYGDNWDHLDGKELSPEMVFTVEFMEPPGNGNVEMRLMGPRTNTLDAEGLLGWDRRGDEADVPTMDLFSQYEDGDERRDETVTYDFVSLIDGMTYSATIPLGVKYNEVGEAINANSDCNFHILRYADALLMFAEALNEVGQTSTAETHLNRIRRRAFNDMDHDITGLSQDGLRDAILQERRLELALEGHRWFDLVRTGRYIETMRSHAITEANLAGEPVKLEIGENIQDHMVLMPIPLVELEANEEVIQNPGY